MNEVISTILLSFFTIVMPILWIIIIIAVPILIIVSTVIIYKHSGNKKEIKKFHKIASYSSGYPPFNSKKD